EVPRHLILDCIRAINAYRPATGIRPTIVVCCRLEDYKPYAGQLVVQRVLLIEPLSQGQIDQYLANPNLAGLKQALADDNGLLEVATTPLMLSLIALTFKSVPAPSILVQQSSRDFSLEQRHREFFSRYVKVQLAREYRQYSSRYKMDDTLRWLSWLANLV